MTAKLKMLYEIARDYSRELEQEQGGEPPIGLVEVCRADDGCYYRTDDDEVDGECEGVVVAEYGEYDDDTVIALDDPDAGEKLAAECQKILDGYCPVCLNSKSLTADEGGCGCDPNAWACCRCGKKWENSYKENPVNLATAGEWQYECAECYLPDPPTCPLCSSQSYWNGLTYKCDPCRAELTEEGAVVKAPKARSIDSPWEGGAE